MENIPTLPKKKRQDDCEEYGFDSTLNTFFYNDIEEICSIDHGTFTNVEMIKYRGENVVLKKLHENVPSDIRRNFIKEPLLHSKISHSNISSFIAVCNTPASFVMELCEFTFKPFGRENTVYSLEKFYDFLNEEKLLEYFPQIGNWITKDVTSAISYLHSENIVHRDINPSNILVTNSHYSFLDKNKLASVYQNRPIICKISDFGDACLVDRTIEDVSLNSRILGTNRKHHPFLAPEVILDKFMSKNVSMFDLKAVDVWALMMIYFVALNPDQKFPFDRDLNKNWVSQQDFCMKFNKTLSTKQIPTFSENLFPTQAAYYQVLRAVFIDSYRFDADSRPTAQELCKKLESMEQAIIQPLLISQASAMEKADNNVANSLQNNLLPCLMRPENDGTNACAFLAIGIIDMLFSNGCDITNIQKDVEHLIEEFPLKFNRFRDMNSLVDIYEAYQVLQSNNLLLEKYDIKEKFVENQRVYSYELQKSFTFELNAALNQSKEKSLPSFLVYHAHIYIFAIVVTTAGEILVIETHPIGSRLGGNGNGAIIRSTTPVVISEWICRRLYSSNVNGDSTPYLMVLRPESFHGSDAKDESSNHADESYQATSVQSEEGSDDSVIILEPIEKNQQSQMEHVCENSQDSDDSVTIIEKNLEEVNPISLKQESKVGKNVRSIMRKSNLFSRSNNDQSIPVGTLYNDDPALPVFRHTKDTFLWNELIEAIYTKYEEGWYSTAPPVGIAHSVTFLVDTRRLKEWGDVKCDDMGSWLWNGKPEKLVDVEFSENGEFRSADSIVGLDRTQSIETGSMWRTVILKRIYYKNKSHNDVRKMIAFTTDSDGNHSDIALVQYIFDKEEHCLENIQPHGNTKNNKTAISYRRLQPSTITKMKNSSKHEQPKKLLDQIYVDAGDVRTARSHSELPRGPQSIYNARHNSRTTWPQKQTTSNSSFDSLWCLMEKAKREEMENGDLFIRDCQVHPTFFAVLAHDRQLKELKQFCTNPQNFCVYGFDPTFNIFADNLSLTVSTYRNLRLENKATKKSPVFIGPLLIHEKKDWKTYSKFAHCLITEEPALSGVLACGTDGEVPLHDGLKRNFPWATFLRCFLHVKKNIERELTRRGFSAQDKRLFMSEIFGRQVDNTKYMGLVDCTSRDEFDTKLQSLKEDWLQREGRQIADTGSSFFAWFLKFQAEMMKETMLASVRTEAGLGLPPSEYTNNDTEAGNYVIKYAMSFDPKKPHEFIEEVKKLVEQQFREEDRAVFGKGKYIVEERFQHMRVSDDNWHKLTHQQRKNKIMLFENAGMDSALEVTNMEQRLDEDSRPPALSMSAKESGIKTIPEAILLDLFTRAEELLATEGLVIPTPGATNGSFIVSGQGNNIFKVTVGRGKNSLKCDCSNVSSNICEHVIAVAQKKGILKEFVSWFKTSKSGGLAFTSGTPNIGKKPSRRKITNKKKKEVTNHVDLLGDIAQTIGTLPHIPNISFSVASSFNPVTTVAPIPSNQGLFSSPLSAVEKENKMHNNLSSTSAYPNFGLHLPQFHSTAQDENVLHQFANLPVDRNCVGFQSNSNLLPTSLSLQNRSSLLTNPLPRVTIASTNENADILKGFSLKWVRGTTVSMCYGCGLKIFNPPPGNSPEEDLCVVHRDFREFYDRLTGQKSITDKTQNVHFHTSVACIQRRYPQFIPQDIILPRHIHHLLSDMHRLVIQREFGVSL